MRKVKVKELSVKDFGVYGSFANMINPKTVKIGAEPCEFYRDMVKLDLGGKAIASFSTCRVTKRPNVVDVTEYHSSCGEGILPLDGDILIHVAPATPNGVTPFERMEIFHVPKGTLVSLNPGVWHHGPFTVDTETANVLIVLPERTYANDCQVVEIPKEKQVQIG